MTKVLITGDTYKFKSILKSAGYTWDAGCKAWTMEYKNDVTEQQAIQDVRNLAGIRNRGQFTATIDDQVNDD